MGASAMRVSIPVAILTIAVGVLGRQALLAAHARGVESCLHQAYACLERGEYADAVILLEQAVERNPDSPGLRAAFAEALEAFGRQREAVGQYERCVALEPGDASSQWALASAYARLGRYREAAAAVRRYASTHGWDYSCYRLLSYCYGKTGATARARVTRKKAELLANQNSPRPCARAGSEPLYQCM